MKSIVTFYGTVLINRKNHLKEGVGSLSVYSSLMARSASVS